MSKLRIVLIYSLIFIQVASALICFFLVMSLHPEIQKRAQSEIDAVTGGQRLPLCADLEHLPYLRRVMQEILRWGTVAPLGLYILRTRTSSHRVLSAGIPHAPLRDDEFDGYAIEKGSTVFANLW